MESVNTSTLAYYKACKLSKSQRVVSREPRDIPDFVFDKLYTDTIGPIILPDKYRAKYLLIVTDAKTRYYQTFPLALKSHVILALQSLISLIRTAHNKVPKIFFTNGSGEYINGSMAAIAKMLGIRQDVSALYILEQNGTTKSANKVIETRIRSIMVDANIPLVFQPLTVSYATYITNRLANLRTSRIPFLKLIRASIETKIDLRSIRRFGYKAYVYDREPASKFVARAYISQFVGFQEDSDINYRILVFYYDSNRRLKHRVKIIPYVSFNEDTIIGYLLGVAQPFQHYQPVTISID